MKKKILSLLLALLIMVSLTPLTLLTAAAEGVGSVLRGVVDTTPTVSIEPVQRHAITNNSVDAPAKPDASGYAYFIIKATGEITEDITVHYTTEDLSAVAEAKDYEKKSGTVVLTKANPEVQISVKTARTAYSLNVNVSGGAANYAYVSRSFIVKLTGVDGNARLANGENGKGKSQVECALLAEHNLDAYAFGSTTVLTPYTWYGKYDIKNALNTEAIDYGESYKKSYDVSFPTSWAADYVHSGLGAHLYMSLQNAHIDESSWNSEGEIAVYIADVSVNLKGEFHNNEEFGWGPALLYALYGIKDIDGDSGKLKDYYNENFISVIWNHSGSYNVLNKDGYSMQSYLNRDYVIVRKYQYYGEPNSISADPGLFYLYLSDGVLNKKTIDVILRGNEGYARRLSGGDISFRLEDVNAPTIAKKDNGSYQIYHNFNTATVGDKLKLAIRFSEPVQVDGKTPYITGKINGVGTGVEPHPYAIRFNYAGGSGTDTLYFEADYSGEYQINSITDLTFTYDSSIKDLAGEANVFTAESGLIIDGFNLDKRDPIISVSYADSKMTEWGRSKQVPITVSNISEDAILYYAWTDSTDAPKTYESNLSLTNVAVNGTKIATITGGGNGVKYLHLKVVTRYGQQESLINVVSSGVTTSNKYIGPYRFDNTAPTVDEALFLPKDGSTMITKQYKIPAPEDKGAGFSELKMYYVGQDGKNHLVENKVFTDKSFKNSDGSYHDVSFALDASEVGVGSNIRRTVTVFFALTDSVGNSASEVARHNVVFDTNEYIDIKYEGSHDAFLEKTEVLDEGYTFIYHGNANYTYFGSFYTFMFKARLWELNGETVVKASYNGAELTPDSDFGIARYGIKDETDGQQYTVFVVNFLKPMAAGYYDVQFQSYETTTPGAGDPDRVSMVYRVYIGSDKGALGETIDKGTTLANKVYQLPSASYFYYMDTNGTIGTVTREAYNGTTLPASFSSSDKAYEYVRFNEYRDLYAIVLTAELAEALNAANSSAQKALRETTVAMEGQVWIRYKSASWDATKAPISSDWVFYYYGTSTTLDVSQFSTLLSEAIDSVATRIVATGKSVALTKYSVNIGNAGTSYVDKNGAPYLAPQQVHNEDIRLDEVRANSVYFTDITYTADTAIYSSSVVIGGVEYALIGNVIIPSGTRFQYKRIDESGAISEEWIDLVSADGQRFRDVLSMTGKYVIRQLGKGGTTLLNVYIDNDAPMVLVSWVDKDGATMSQILTQSSEVEFRARTFKVIGIDSRECDRYSYVSFYRMSDSKLYAVCTMNELQTSSYQLPDGNYYMVVADRTGNSYEMKLYINSSRLNCEIKESENVKIKFTCDRKESQIQEFYVTRNGVLVSGKYATELEFTESGTYEFYVRDIYGNVFGPEIYEFNRIYPEASWKYLDATGHYVAYDSQNKTKYFTLDSIQDGVYTISTSVGMKFYVPTNYRFAFIGNVPDHDENTTDRTVTIKTAQSFQLKVYYEKHQEIYTIYNCIADTFAPVIDVSVQVDDLVPDELDEFSNALESGSLAGGGSVLIPSKISYSSTGTQTRRLANNETVVSDFIKVNVTDESGIARVYVYLDDVLVKEYTSNSAISNIVLNRSGKYRIVAEDALGNRTEFAFTNGTPDELYYVVDGLPMKLGLRDFEKFDENGNYLDSTFGNDFVALYTSDKTNVFYMIGDGSGNKCFVAFDISGGVVRELYYCLDSENNIVLQTSAKVLFDTSASTVDVNKEYILYTVDKIGLNIYAMATAAGDVILKIYPDDDKELSVEARINTSGGSFYYTKTELSGFRADLMIKTSEGTLDIAETNQIIKLNRPFSISTSDFESSKVSFAEVYYSRINDFALTGFFTKPEIYGDNKTYEEEGFYYIRLVNVYKNESVFIVHVSYKFDVDSYSEFKDGERNYYSAGYKGDIYSNNKVVFEVYATGVSISVKKDGVDFDPIVNIDNGITYVILCEDGSYNVVLTDSYRNTIERNAVIDSDKISLDKDILTGYNENALKRDEGYTNQMLSVDKAILDEQMIFYLAVQYGQNLDVILDGISEGGVALDESRLKNVIGRSGDGVYTVIARNRYGAVATKVIHYRSTPTLTLEREIRSSTEVEIYDIDKALQIGFWSNSELIFKTDSEYYVLKVNGDKNECPLTLSFGTAQHGHSEYEISYVDEYGFQYSFKAHLLRQDLEIKADIGSSAEIIDGVLTTRGNVGVIFSENATCTYTWNNSEEKVYTPGEQLSRDGVYRFVATDHAGNASAITIKKDTTVEFAFIRVNSSTEIENGGVVNSSKVSFEMLNNDSAYIEKVFKNGVEQVGFSGTKFADDGKWEIIVSDKLGNKAYFSFYIITKAKNGFAYTTPYEYRITEVWYDGGDGVKISYIKFVDHTDTSSSFEFTENGKYTVVMASSVTGGVSQFEFTVNTTAPDVSLVGCGVGGTTINDVTLSGCVVGDRIKVYKSTRTGEKLVEEIEVTSSATKMPTIDEGGEYRIVVESEAGVKTELNFVRKHVMNTEGSIFVMVVIGVIIVGLFIGLIYRNKSKTDN